MSPIKSNSNICTRLVSKSAPRKRAQLNQILIYVLDWFQNQLLVPVGHLHHRLPSCMQAYSSQVIKYFDIPNFDNQTATYTCNY